MKFILQSWQMFMLILSCWVNRYQQRNQCWAWRRSQGQGNSASTRCGVRAFPWRPTHHGMFTSRRRVRGDCRSYSTGAFPRFVLAAGCVMFIVGSMGCGRGDTTTTHVGSSARSTTANGSSDPSPAAPTGTPETNHSADDSGLAQFRKGNPSWFTDRDDPSSDGWDSEVFSQKALAQLNPRFRLSGMTPNIATSASPIHLKSCAAVNYVV